jgi:hypothetical protein
MSYEYRVERINKIINDWGLEKKHDLMARYKVPKKDLQEFKVAVKLYISKALNFSYSDDDEKFITLVDAARNYRKNVTPNGAVVPKREFHLEYNMILRQWCKIIEQMTEKNKKLLSRFRATPNIRIKFSEELDDNVGRGLNTALPHSDAWVEGPWGMNCYFPLFGDVKKNNLHFYTPIKFEERFLSTAATYNDMQWVLEFYKSEKNLLPEKDYICISDYALIHNTMREKGAGTRISIDTTVFVGDHLPHDDRLIEYRSEIPKIGINEFIDAGRSENDEIKDNKTTFSHYTSGKIRSINLEKI